MVENNSEIMRTPDGVWEKIKTVFAWIVSLFIGITGGGMIYKYGVAESDPGNKVIAGMVYLTGGLILCPPASAFIERKLRFRFGFWSKTGLIFILLFVAWKFLGSPK